MSLPLISVVIPVYNHEEDFLVTLQSLSQQMVAGKIEVITIDDGSLRPLAEPQDLLIKNFLSFRLIRQDNAGAPAARNAGLRLATGEYVIFWDADVTAPADFLLKLLETLQKNQDIDVAYSDHFFGETRMVAGEFTADKLSKRNTIHTTALIRREKAFFWDESLRRFQDWDYWLTAIKRGWKGRKVETVFFVCPRLAGGMSTHLPRYAYYPPFCFLSKYREKVAAYRRAQMIIRTKHSLR